MIDCRESQRFSSSWTTDFSKKKSVWLPSACSLGQTNHAGFGKAQWTACCLPVFFLVFVFLAPLHGSHWYSKHALLLHYWKAISELPFILYSPIPDPRSPHLHAALLLGCFPSSLPLLILVEWRACDAVGWIHRGVRSLFRSGSSLLGRTLQRARIRLGWHYFSSIPPLLPERSALGAFDRAANAKHSDLRLPVAL